MANKIIKIFLLGSLYSLLITEILLAGREAEYSDKYPKFTRIVQTDSSILFAGVWINRYIIAERVMDGKWHIYTSIGNKNNISYATISDIPEGLLFISVNGYYKKFLYPFKAWVNIKSKTERVSYSKYLYSKQNEPPDLEIQHIIKKIKLPLPSYNAFKRWRFLPNASYHLEAHMGSVIKKAHDLWFLIDFYDGEGLTGIGGIGLYDIKEKKMGVIRDKMLASCSGGLLTCYGDTLIVATNHSGEYGIYGDRGIILLDTKKGLLANLPKAQAPLDGDYFLILKLIDDALWITTDRSIISWDMKNDLWKIYKIESLVVNKKCPIYRRAISYSDFSNGGLPRHVDYDSTFIISHFNPGDIIKFKWPSFKFSEILSNKEISGWMSKEKYLRFIKGIKYQRVPRYPLEILYSDSTLRTPYHSFFSTQIVSAELYDKTVYLTINTAWINSDDGEPVLDESTVQLSPQIKWHSILTSENSIKNQAFSTFNIEQEEIRERIPILETTLTFCDTMDLFKTFYGILYARWLPSNKFDGNQYPQGIKINNGTEFWLKNNKLEHNGRILSIGDTVYAVDGDASYTYKILDFKVDKADVNHLIELSVKYTVVMIPSKQW